MVQKTDRLFVEVRQMLTRSAREELSGLLGRLHPADIADLLEELEDEERLQLLDLFDAEQAADIMEEVDPRGRSRVLQDLHAERAAEILEEMANDDVADVLGDMAPGRVLDILDFMEDREAADVQELLEYLEDTAGGIMTTEVVALEDELTAGEAIDTLRRLALEAETVYYVYVINEAAQLQGVLSLRELIMAHPETPVREFMQTNVIAVTPEQDQEEVAQVVAKYDLLAVPVVGPQDELLGIVTVDDVLDVVEEEATEDIYRISGAPPEDVGKAVMTVWNRAVDRFPWLLIVLAAELVAASVIEGFTHTLQTIVALAYFVPVLTGMGGNVGTQSLAVTVRGLATGDFLPEDLLSALWFQLRVGFLVGLGSGAVALTVTLFWQKDLVISAIVGCAMLLNMLSAAVIGTLVPFLLSRYDVDPAVASGPFVTTFLDIVGLFNYFLIATAFLSFFGYGIF